jgi:hypothetical protein
VKVECQGCGSAGGGRVFVCNFAWLHVSDHVGSTTVKDDSEVLTDSIRV